MPLYEYRCRKCGTPFTVLTLRVSAKALPRCDACGSRAATRLLSRFAMPKSEEARLEALADPSNLAGIDANDPQGMARSMRKMGSELGDEVGGDDFDEMVEELDAGPTAEGDDNN